MNKFNHSKWLLLLIIIVSTSALFSGCANSFLPELKDELFSEYRNQVNKGNNLFKTEDFDNASKAYHNAELEAPESPVVNNNIGNVFYKQDNFEKSEEYFRKAIDRAHSNKQHLQKAHYNLGNSLFKQDKLEDAILEYKTALELNPDDVDAKFNLEFARIKLKEKIQEQQKQQQQNNQNQKQDDKMEKHKLPDDEKKEENSNCQNKKEAPQQGEKKEKKQDQAGSEKKQDQEDKKENEASQNKQDKKENDISKEEALRILRSLDDKEKNKNKERMIQVPAGDYIPDKDW